METTKYPNCAKGCNDGGAYPCDCAMPAPSAPACFKCDDLGYTTGNEVFNVARCDCAIGTKADMRALYGPMQPTTTEKRLARAERALKRAGFEDHGAEEWKPPLGPAPHFITVRDESLKPLLERAYDLIDEARTAGQVLTIDLVPLKPLAMGHYEMVADLRPARERAPSPSIIDMIRESPEPGAWMDESSKRASRMLEAIAPLKTMMHPDRRTEARKVIWPVPDPKNFTLERRDAFSTLTDEQFDKRQSDRRKREAK